MSDSLANTGESSRDSFRVLDVVREPENCEKIRKREVSKDKAKGKTVGADLIEPFESMAFQGGIKFGRHEAKGGSVEKTGKNLMKGSRDVSLDQSENKRIKGNRIPASNRGDSDFSESDSRGPSDNLVKKSHLRPTSLEQDALCMAEMTNKFESKKKSRVSQVNNVKLYSGSVQESGRVGSSLAAKEKKGIKKGVNKVRNMYKDIFETNTEPSVHPTDMSEKPSSDRLKDPKFDTVKEKNVHADKFKEKSSYHRSDNQLNSEKLAKNPPPGSVPPVDGPPLLSEQAIVAPVLIAEDWVCCDRCQKWRLLPYGTKPEQLPEKWLCSMLNWLPGMNRCDISEEETTKALHSLYQIPPPENQNGAQYQPERTAPGVNSVDQFNFNYQNIVSDYMTDGKKKQYKLNETSNKGSKAGLGPAAKNLQLDAVKKDALNDMKQFTTVNPVKKSNGQHLNKSDNSKHSNRQKQEHVPGGNANLKRKINRESDQFGNGNTKKFKSEGILNNSQASGENLGRMGVGSNSDLPTMALVKEKQRTSESGYSKDSNAGEEKGLQPFARKRADLGGTMSLDMKKYTEGENSSKRRNLKNWQNSPSNLEAVRSDGSYLNNNSMPVKEESSDREFRRNKKPRMSQNDGKDFRIKVPNNEQRRKDATNRPLSSGGKENTISRVHDKEKQLKKYKIKIASQLTIEDLESLKRDLGSEPLSTTATSSSSKVSDSRKNRTNYQGVKGSPVESVSSSPVRMSKTIKNSPRVDICGADDVRQGDFSIKSPRKMVDGKKGTKKKGCDVLHPETLNYPVPETVGRDKFGGKSGAGPKPSAFGNDHHLYDNHLGMSEHGPCQTDLHASESCYSKGIGNKNQHFHSMSVKPKSANSSLPPKDSRRASGINCEGTLGKVSDLPNNQGISNSNQTWTDNADTDQSHVTPFGEVTDNLKHSFPSRSGLKCIKNHKNVVKMDSRKCGDHTRKNQLKCGELESTATKQGNNPCSVDTTIQQNLNQGFQAQISCREGNMQIDKHSKDQLDIPTSGKLAPGTQDGVLLSLRPYDIPVVADVSKETKDHQNAIEIGESHHGITHSATDCSVRDIVGPSLVRRDASGQAASLALKEAEELRDYADRLKDSGFDYECNEAYFQAALRFLHGASLLESTESGKLGEMNQIQIYINTAKLCETLAQEYEKVAQMAAAALAYKCMEVAYMRVVYCKNSSANRLWHDLQTSLQMAPQGESPSSSASDIDNLNNQALVDKTSLSKSNGTHYGSNIIASRNRPNFARLFDFTKDVNSAMEASRKSHVAFSAANAILEEAQNKEGIISVKRVIDFSFQDVEELVRLVRIAVEAISRQRFSGSRD